MVGDFCLGEDYQDDIATVLDSEQLQLITMETYTKVVHHCMQFIGCGPFRSC